MTDTYTSRNRATKQGFNTNEDQWGAPILNQQVIDVFDTSLDGVLVVTTTGGTYTLTTTNGSSGAEAIYRAITVSGTLASDAIITIPNNEKWYFVRNVTSGSYSVYVKNASESTSALIPQDSRDYYVVTDGTNTRLATPNALRSSNAAPTSNTGNDGDFLLDYATYTLYGPKASGSWPAGVSLIGPTGGADVIASTTSTVTFTGGSQTVTVETGKAFVPGYVIRVSDATNPTTSAITGVVTSYTSGTGELVFTGSQVTGTGTSTDATITPGTEESANTVANGKTGATSFTDGGVLVGNGTGAIQATSAGTAGQVLTSQGAGVDPVFQDATPNGTTIFTASGSIGAGDVVRLNTDGTVSVVAGFAEQTLNAVSTSYTDSCYDEASGKVFVVGYPNTNGYPQVFVGQVSGGDIVFGTAQQAVAENGQYVRIAYDPDAARVVVFYAGSASHPRYVTGTVSGTTISFSSAEQIAAFASIAVELNYDPDQNVMIFSWSDNAAGNNARLRAGSWNGTNYTMGTQIDLKVSNIVDKRIIYDTANSFSIVIYRDVSASALYARPVIASGTSLTIGNELLVNGAQSDYVDAVWLSGISRGLTTYRRSASLSAGYSYFYYTSSSTGFANGTYLLTTTSIQGTAISYNSGSNIVCLTYAQGSGGLYTVVGTPVYGSALTSSSLFELRPSGANYNDLSASYLTSGGLHVVNYAGGAGSYFNAQPFSQVYGATDGDTWIGLATSAVSDTASGYFTILGGVNTQQSGLTSGTTYYVSPAGSLTTTSTQYPVGRATASNAVYIEKTVLS